MAEAEGKGSSHAGGQIEGQLHQLGKLRRGGGGDGAGAEPSGNSTRQAGPVASGPPAGFCLLALAPRVRLRAKGPRGDMALRGPFLPPTARPS